MGCAQAAAAPARSCRVRSRASQVNSSTANHPGETVLPWRRWRQRVGTWASPYARRLHGVQAATAQPPLIASTALPSMVAGKPQLTPELILWLRPHALPSDRRPRGWGPDRVPNADACLDGGSTACRACDHHCVSCPQYVKHWLHPVMTTQVASPTAAGNGRQLCYGPAGVPSHPSATEPLLCRACLGKPL